MYKMSDNLDLETVRQLHAVDASVARLRQALAKRRPDQPEQIDEMITKIAKDAYAATRTLAQTLKNTPARPPVGRLLALLTPYTTAQQLAA